MRMWRAASSPPAAWLYAASLPESTLKVFCTESMKCWSFCMFTIGATAASIAFLSLSESLCAAAYASCWYPVQMSATIAAVSRVHRHLDLGVAEQVAEPRDGQLLRAGAGDDVDVRGESFLEPFTGREQRAGSRDANDETRAHEKTEEVEVGKRARRPGREARGRGRRASGRRRGAST